MTTRRPPSRHPFRLLAAVGVALAVVLVPGVAWADGGAGIPSPPPNPLNGLTNTLGGLLGGNLPDPTGGTDPASPSTATADDPPTLPPPPPQLAALLQQLQQHSQISPDCVNGVLQDVQLIISDIPATLQDLLAQLAAGLQQGGGSLGQLVPLGTPQPDGSQVLTLPVAQPASSSGTGAVAIGSPSDLQNSQLADDIQKLVKDFTYNCLPKPALPTTGTAPTPAPPTPAPQNPVTPAAQPVQYPGYAPTGGSGPAPPAGPVPLSALCAAVLLLSGAGVAASRMRSRAPRSRG